MHADSVRHLGMKSRDINEKLHNKINNTVPCEDFVNCFPSSRQSKKYKVFSASRYYLLADFYAACKYVSCFSIGVNTPRFLCKRLLL